MSFIHFYEWHYYSTLVSQHLVFMGCSNFAIYHPFYLLFFPTHSYGHSFTLPKPYSFVPSCREHSGIIPIIADHIIIRIVRIQLIFSLLIIQNSQHDQPLRFLTYLNPKLMFIIIIGDGKIKNKLVPEWLRIN